MVLFNLFFSPINKPRTSISPSYFGIFVANQNFQSSFNDLNDAVLQVKTAISSTKKTKQQHRYYKTINITLH